MRLMVGMARTFQRWVSDSWEYTFLTSSREEENRRDEKGTIGRRGRRGESAMGGTEGGDKRDG